MQEFKEQAMSFLRTANADSGRDITPPVYCLAQQNRVETMASRSQFGDLLPACRGEQVPTTSKYHHSGDLLRPPIRPMLKQVNSGLVLLHS